MPTGPKGQKRPASPAGRGVRPDHMIVDLIDPLRAAPHIVVHVLHRLLDRGEVGLGCRRGFKMGHSLFQIRHPLRQVRRKNHLPCRCDGTDRHGHSGDR